MKIKICGITNYDDASLCANLGADAIGFIFYDKSKRYVPPEKVKKIIEATPPFLLKIGVFVNEKTEIINRIAKDIKLNMIQLHGDELPEDVEKISLPVIKAFRVSDNFDFTILDKYESCNYLLDTFSKTDFGGTGDKFNWNKIPYQLKSKIILAGGISIKNIKQVSEEISPYAVDISSSVEVKPGIKDHKKLKKLFEKINELRNI